MPDLEAIRARAEAARQAAASGTTGKPPNIDGLAVGDALDIFLESAEDVPELLHEIERLRRRAATAEHDRELAWRSMDKANHRAVVAEAERDTWRSRWQQLMRDHEESETERARLAAALDRVRELLALDDDPWIHREDLRAAIEGTDS